MARSTVPSKTGGGSATCDQCGASMKRVSDLPRHMLLHAKNKDEHMYACPVEGCTHATLQKSNLATHIRTHTRAKPHKCPEYFPNGQKCNFATADPSSLHRHRKRKHGLKPRSSTATSSASAPGSGERDKSVDSFESEESFALQPATEDAAHDTAPAQSTSNNLSYAIHHPYLNPNKLSGRRYDSPHYPPLVLKVPDWIGVPLHLPSQSAFQTFSCGPGYGHLTESYVELGSPVGFANDASLLKYWPQLASEDFNGRCANYLSWDNGSAEISNYPSTFSLSNSFSR
ncbi:hypothetical protein DFH07DRAFT_473597 [Mycena maculata]|uniref:C2H2-type domain-containing protein n=1 Tax=Mycena maculata TaxID=230809 RepID=A0AAD7J8J6_9AGAR|nr:hypothetical protein DFH07DRAFT_473597 [Mycena maculata]